MLSPVSADLSHSRNISSSTPLSHDRKEPAALESFDLKELPPLTPKQQAEFEKFLKELEAQLQQLEQDQLDGTHPQGDTTATNPTASTEEPKVPVPAFSPQQLGMPLNPLYNETFSTLGQTIKLITNTIGAPAAKFRALPSSFHYLAGFLGYSIKYGLEGVVGTACGVASLFLLKSQIEYLLAPSPEHQSPLEKTIDRAKTVALATLCTYGALSGFATLGAAKLVGAACTMGALKVMGSTTNFWVKVPTVAAGLVAGLSSFLGYSSALPGLETLTGLVASAIGQANIGRYLISMVANNAIGSFLLMTLPIAISLTQNTAIFVVIDEARQAFQKDMAAINDSGKYAGTFEQLSHISQEEYQETIARLMGVPTFDDSKPYFELFRTIEPHHPENIARPIIAKLYVTDIEVKQVFQKYSNLLHSNKLIEAEKCALEEFRPLMLKFVYLRQCIMFPFRPEMGKINVHTDQYESLTTHLFSQLLFGASVEDREFLTQKVASITEQDVQKIHLPSITMPLEMKDPLSMESELIKVLDQEVQLYNFYYEIMHQRNLMMQMAMQQQLQQQNKV